MAGPSGPTGRENGAQGFGQRPMPWVNKPRRIGGLKGRGNLNRGIGSENLSRPFRPRSWIAFLPGESACGLIPGLESPGPMGRWLPKALPLWPTLLWEI